jgi:hypothetical protein
MRSLWRKFRAWRAARRERYAEGWAATKPYDSRADQYLSPTRPDSLPPGGGGVN